MSKDNQFEYYEKVYYSYQTKGRGILSKEELIDKFEQKYNRYEELLGEFLPRDREAQCIDLGCGYGNFLYFLNKKGYKKCLGFDNDISQIKLAESLDLNVKCTDALSELKNLKEIDLISALDFIEHINKNNAVYCLETCFQALSMNGILLLQCPCADGFTGAHDVFNDLTHRWGASSNMLSQLLYTVGFKEVRILDPSLPEFPTTLRRKLLFLTRKTVRHLLSFVFRLVGIKTPRIWANSQIAIAWKSR